MSYTDDEIDFGWIVREADRRKSEEWIKINEYCKINQKKQEDLVREAFKDIKRRHRGKLAIIEDPITPDWRRASIIFEYILTTIL